MRTTNNTNSIAVNTRFTRRNTARRAAATAGALFVIVAGPGFRPAAAQSGQTSKSTDAAEVVRAASYFDCVFGFDFLNQACQPTITIGCLTTDSDCPPPPVESGPDGPLAIARGLEIVVGQRGLTSGIVRSARPSATDVLVSPNPTCEGRPATIVGTGGADLIVGTNGPDVIVAGSGDDRVYGLNGADVVCLGSGDDYVDAGNGNDIAYGHDGKDQLFGANGADWLNGQWGDDMIVGGADSDTHRGESGRPSSYPSNRKRRLLRLLPTAGSGWR